MTNYEKYKDELLKHVIAHADIGLEIHTNKLIDCSDLRCEKCKFNANGMFMCKNVWEMEKWLDSEYVEPEKEEVDWSKVPIDTKVLVSDDNGNWVRGYFAYYRGERILVFRSGLTSWTINDLSEVSGWKYGKLLEDK